MYYIANTCNVAETIKHFILECSDQTDLQLKLSRICSSIYMPYSLNNILNNVDCQREIYTAAVVSGRKL